MKRHERNYLSIAEFGCCYPMQFLEFLHVFEIEGQKQVLLDNEAIKIIDLLFEKTERLKTEKLISFLNNEDTPENKNSLNWQGSNLDFITKTELFFVQLKYCLVIDPEPLITTDNGFYSLALDPETFFKLITDFYIDYPFIPENKIIELKTLMIKDKIKTTDALKIIQNFKDQYWVLDAVTMFEPVIEKFKKSHRNINKNISEKELNIELFNYDKYLKAKRDKIYCDLVNELNTELIEVKTTQITTPKHENIFCNNGFVLFEYILTNHIAEKRGRINDISFYYWKMYNDKYIIQKPFVFVEWFMNVYNVDNFQIKTLETATDRHRPTHYSNALDWFKLQNH